MDKIKIDKLNEKYNFKANEFKKCNSREESINNFYANYDIITELPNSIYFFEKLNKKLGKIRFKGNEKGAVIYIDIDNYKVINYNLGYGFGDLVLKAFSKRLNSCIKKEGIVARLNGDEFAIIIDEVSGIRGIENICSRIYECLNKPLKIFDNYIKIDISMGIAIFPDNSMEANELLKFCDFALHESKRKGKGTYTFFNNESLDNYHREHLIRNRLKNAIHNGEFELFYQPQINTEKNNIRGIEALLRWRNSKLGNVSPQEFIPIAEKYGYMSEIGEWVLEEALRQAVVWKNKGYEFDNVSVNVSPIQMRNVNFKDYVLNMCNKYDISPKYLEIEITEGLLIDVSKENINILNEFIENGIKIAIDDFGTGYSSLSYIMNIPISTLKIDKIFIDNIQNNKNIALIESLVNLSKRIKYSIVIEGVEKKSQLDILTNLGCNIIQGFYFSKPISSSEMEKLFGIYK